MKVGEAAPPPLLSLIIIMKYFSMFSGIGGFELGIQQAYENKSNKKYRERTRRIQCSQSERDKSSIKSFLGTECGVKCIGYSEIDKYAIQIYKKHFNHKNYGDATTIDTQQLPDFDLLVGGFPCQAFSIAGKRKGFNDTRGTLFFEIARILKDKRPRYFLLENVKGLLSHEQGKTFQTILRVLTDLGYRVEWQVLNSKNFGVPQNRERVFIIGYLRGTSRPKVFPIREGSKRNNKQGKGEIAATLRGFGHGWQGQHNSTNAVRQPLKFLQRNQRNIDGDYSFTVDGANTGGIKKGTRIRRLTPTECERLQGFPDGWTEGISDTQRYKCLGNAVTVNVIKEIIPTLST